MEKEMDGTGTIGAVEYTSSTKFGISWSEVHLPSESSSSQCWQQGQVEVLFGGQKLGPEQCKSFARS